jgi:hypothetical protein
VLLARLYADLMIARKDGNSPNSAPRNIPDLVLAYLNSLNQRRLESVPDNITVQGDAKKLACLCTRELLQPSDANVNEALDELSGERARERFNYLKDHLGLLQSIGPDEQRFRFALDPLAEYLAAQHMVDHYDLGQWTELLCRLAAAPGPVLSWAPLISAVLEYSAVRHARRTEVLNEVVPQLARHLKAAQDHRRPARLRDVLPKSSHQASPTPTADAENHLTA